MREMISCMSWLMMLLRLLTPLILLFWIALLDAWGYLLGLGMFVFLFTIKSDFGFNWLFDLVNLGVEGGIPQG